MKKDGSASIEATISFSIFFLLFLLFIHIINAIGFYQEIKGETDRISLEISKIYYLTYVISTNQDKDISNIDKKIIEYIDFVGKDICVDSAVNIMVDDKYRNKYDKAGGEIISSDLGDRIKVYIDYKVKLPFLGLIPRIPVNVCSIAKCWEGGDEGEDLYIWQMDPIKRGRKLEDIFHCNLPFGFPVLDYFNFSTGKAVLQTSIDTTREYYINISNLENRVMLCMDRLSEFSGGEREGVKINENDITSKVLRIIIPKNDLTNDQENIFSKITIECGKKNIEFNVVRYGFKTE